MKKITLTTILGLYSVFSIAQTYLIQVRPIGSKLWKYANLKGEIMINCEYPKTYPFSKEDLQWNTFPKKTFMLLLIPEVKKSVLKLSIFT